MLKKIMIGLGIALVAIFVFFTVQLNQFKAQFAQVLAKQQIQVKEISLSLFGKPKIELNQVKYHQLYAEKVEIEPQLWAALNGEIVLSALNIKAFYWAKQTDNFANIQINFNQGLSFNREALQFSDKTQIQIVLAKSFYGKNKQYDLQFEHGHLLLESNNQYLFNADAFSINQQNIGRLEVRSNSSMFLAMLENARIYYQPINSISSEVDFSGSQFSLKKLSKIFNFPETINANANFDVHLFFQQGELSHGRFTLLGQNGEIEGFNLLQVVGQYLPINYDEQSLQQKNLNTPFEELYTEFELTPTKLDLQIIRLKTPVILAQGNGEVELRSMKCDVNLSLHSANPKYENIELPLQFFGHCSSPQYRVKFNQNFRHSLKEIIKQKLR